ncbi:MAG: VWA domain-containing protein [Chitinophagales bacterium]|nr:VWA domain-containing protein [Chitinophagales bacterium]
MIFGLEHITFANKWVLWLIPVAVVFMGFLLLKRRKTAVPAFTYSETSAFKNFRNPIKGKLIEWLPILRMLSVVSLLVAIARPQTSFDESKVTTQGIDIVMSMDVSSSMLARDFKPNRLEAAKKTALDFVDGRPNDRVGLVIFGGESFTQCPVTIDHAVVKNQLKDIKNGLLEDGTAIGMGLATATQRLKESESKSKVVILMTDGVNNKGLVDPTTAADIAVQYGVRVYTIGVGTQGQAYTPVAMDAQGNLVYDYAEVQIDEPLLKDVAKKTGGQYFRATNNKKLEDIFQEIDKLEKTKILVSAYTHKTEKFLVFALLALILLCLEWWSRYTILKSFP